MERKVSNDDMRICAYLVVEMIIGSRGKMRTRNYKKEKQITRHAFSMYNRLARETSSALAMMRGGDIRVISHPIGTSHTLQVDQYVSTGDRKEYYCATNTWTASAQGSHVFDYEPVTPTTETTTSMTTETTTSTEVVPSTTVITETRTSKMTGETTSRTEPTSTQTPGPSPNPGLVASILVVVLSVTALVAICIFQGEPTMLQEA
jgi:cobalamin biosynthesis Mg chelatase CobN